MNNTGYANKYNLEFSERADDSKIGKLVTGSIDMHAHFAPEPGVSRHKNALETVLTARELGLGGIVLKNRLYNTVPLAEIVSQLVPDIAVFGAICLDYEGGGLSAIAVESAAKMGAKILWLPVFSAANSKFLVERKTGISIPGEGISILAKDGTLLPALNDILKVVKDYDMVLATGHISAKEILVVVDKARQMGIDKIVITHAMSDYISETILSEEDRLKLAHEGVIIEHTAWEISPTGGRKDPAEVVAAIKAEGPANCIMSSDFGGPAHPSVGEGMRLFISTMLKYGLTPDDITRMVRLNPARLLGMESG
jgi:hypothetical protein